MSNDATSQGVLNIDVPAPELGKGEREHRAFLRLLPMLLKSHAGLYVAIHDEQLIDSESDEISLILRVQAKIGYVPIYVGLVTDQQPLARVPHYHECSSPGSS